MACTTTTSTPTDTNTLHLSSSDAQILRSLQSLKLTRSPASSSPASVSTATTASATSTTSPVSSSSIPSVSSLACSHRRQSSGTGSIICIFAQKRAENHARLSSGSMVGPRSPRLSKGSCFSNSSASVTNTSAASAATTTNTSHSTRRRSQRQKSAASSGNVRAVTPPSKSASSSFGWSVSSWLRGAALCGRSLRRIGVVCSKNKQKTNARTSGESDERHAQSTKRKNQLHKADTSTQQATTRAKSKGKGKGKGQKRSTSMDTICSLWLKGTTKQKKTTAVTKPEEVCLLYFRAPERYEEFSPLTNMIC